MPGHRPLRAPDLAEVTAFAAAVEEGTLARAGARLGISQPAMSKRIRTLEALAGLPLLVRTRTGVVPTEAGRRLYEEATRLLRASDAFGARMAALRAGGTLRVAVIYTLAEHHVAEWLAAHRAGPETGPVEVRVGRPDQVRAWVASGDSDAGFAAGPAPALAGITERPFASDEIVAVLPAGHPFAHGGPVPVADLVAGPLILREPGSGTRRTFDDAVAAAGLAPVTAALTLASTPAIRRAVAEQGIPAVLSRLSVDPSADPGIVVAPISGLELRRPITVLWRTGDLPPGAVRFLAAARIGDACAAAVAGAV